MTRVCPVAGMITEAAAGVWQERGGQGQAVAQQSGSVWQHADAQVSAAGTGCTAAGASGALATLKSNRSSPANLMQTI